MEVILIIFFAVVFVVLLKITGETREGRFLEALPGPEGHPFIGNFLDILKTRQNYLDYALDNEAKFGSIYKTWIGSAPVVHISKPEYVEAVLGTRGTSRLPRENSLITKFLKIHPYNYLSNRSILASAFNSVPTQCLVDIVNENCEILLRKMDESDILERDTIQLCVIDSLCEIILGVKTNTQSKENELFAHSLTKFNYLSKRNDRVRFCSDSIFRLTSIGKEYFYHINLIRNFINDIVPGANKSGSASNENFKSILEDLLIFNGLSSIPGIQDDIFNIIASSLDSIEHSIYSCLTLLAGDAPVQDRLLHEANTCNDLSSIKYLQKLIYTERVIKETLRLFPPIPFIVRELEKDTKLGNYLIPRRTTICIQLRNLQRDILSFPNQNFDPDNFLPKRILKRNKYCYIPFGTVHRNCLGQKLAEIIPTIIVIRVIKTFKVGTKDRSTIFPSITHDNSGIELTVSKRV